MTKKISKIELLLKFFKLILSKIKQPKQFFGQPIEKVLKFPLMQYLIRILILWGWRDSKAGRLGFQNLIWLPIKSVP